MIDRGKQNVLGVAIDAVDYDAAVERVVVAAEARRPLSVAAVSVHGVMTAVSDSDHRYRLNKLDLAVPDGQPVRWALNRLHRAALRDRVYGPTLTWRLWQRAADRGIPIFLYGSRPEVLERLRARLPRQIPGLVIAGTEVGQFRRLSATERQRVIDVIRASGAGMVFVALGCPRQEVWVYEYRDVLNIPLIAVGAAFDFHAGMLAQAPPYLQRFGLEWLYRLTREPKRLWRRYLLTNPPYLGLVALQALGLRRVDTAMTGPPPGELSYG